MNELQDVFIKCAPQEGSLHCEVGYCGNCNGSSFVSVGFTKVVCTVQGPVPITKSNVPSIDVCQVECDVKQSNLLSKYQTESNYEEKISRTVAMVVGSSIKLDSYPKSTIYLNLAILESNGNEIAACVMAASLALIDANIEVFDLVSAFSVVSTKPSLSLTIATMTEMDETLLFEWQGRQHLISTEAMTELCLKGCSNSRKEMESAINRKLRLTT